MADRRAELREMVLQAHNDLEATLNTFQGDDWQRLSPNEGWTAKDTLAHLCSIEVRQRSQVHAILEGGEFPMEPINDYNARQVDERRDQTVEQLRAELAQEHQATMTLLNQVEEADLDRFFEHPVRGHMTIESIYRTINNHTRTHTQDIAATRTTP